MALIQKIFDSGLQRFVYYASETANAAPVSGDTTPNHSGNLVPSTHAIIADTGTTAAAAYQLTPTETLTGNATVAVGTIGFFDIGATETTATLANGSNNGDRIGVHISESSTADLLVAGQIYEDGYTLGVTTGVSQTIFFWHAPGGLEVPKWRHESTVLFSGASGSAEVLVISPPQITATQNDYTPTGIASASSVRLSSDASRDITGLTSAITEVRKRLINVGSFPLVIKHENVGSLAANRFICPGDEDITLLPNDSIELEYDSTSSNWRLV